MMLLLLCCSVDAMLFLWVFCSGKKTSLCFYKNTPVVPRDLYKTLVGPSAMKASVTLLVFLSFRVKALLSYRPLHSPFLPNRSYAVFEDLANANVCVCRFLYIPAPSFNALKWREKGYACILRLGVGVRGVVDAGLIICMPHHYLFIPTEANVWEYESKGAVKMMKRGLG